MGVQYNRYKKCPSDTDISQSAETNQKGIDFMNNFNTEKEIWKDIEGFESEIRKRS